MVSCEMLQYPYRSQNSSILKIINSPGVILDLWSWPCSLSIRMWCWRFCKELRCLLQVNTGMPPASPGPWHREFRPVQRSREKTSSEPECSPLKPSRSVHLVLHSTHSGQAWTCWRTRQHDLFKKKKNRRLVYFSKLAVPYCSGEHGKNPVTRQRRLRCYLLLVLNDTQSGAQIEAFFATMQT